jgi:hypothetical protein
MLPVAKMHAVGATGTLEVVTETPRGILGFSIGAVATTSLDATGPMVNSASVAQNPSNPFSDDMFPELPLDNPAVNAARVLLINTQSYPDVRTIYGLSSQQLSAIQVMQAAYITRPLIVEHREWHIQNSIGGTRGRGSGMILLGMHAIMLRKFELFVDPQGKWRLPGWDGSRALPNELIMDPRFASLAMDRETNIQFISPSLFSAPGRGLGDSLQDFTTLDDVGRAYGLQKHNGVHAAMKHPMIDSFVSPTDPGFWFWHAHIQIETEENWLTSPNGILWSDQHWNHPFLTLVRATPVGCCSATTATLDQANFASSAIYINDGECGNAPQFGSSPICTWLEGIQQQVNPTLA